jgi:hypothetical protein
MRRTALTNLSNAGVPLRVIMEISGHKKFVEPPALFLELSAEKTLITSMEDGFDFLGFNHRHYNGKLLIKPSKKKVLDFCKRIGKEIKALNGC